MARPKSKHAKRDSTTGRSRGPLPDEMVSVALANRVRAYGSHIAVIKDDRTGAPRPNVKAGYPLGVLELTGQISPEQHNAGTAYANMIYRYCSMRGIPMPFPKSPSIIFLAAGKSCGQDPDEQMVLGVRRMHADARRRLLEAGMALGVGSLVNSITYAVCVEEKDALSITQSDLGNLRVGLNALARMK